MCDATHILNEQEKLEQRPCVAQLNAEMFHFVYLPLPLCLSLFSFMK